MARVVIDLEREATVLDAAQRVREAPDDAYVALVVPTGAPFGRNAIFIDVARRLAGARRVAVVTTDARVRSLATSVRVPAYANMASLERDELDPTERLDRSRAAVPAKPRSEEFTRLVASPRRLASALGSLLVALLLLAVVVVPGATVVIAPTATAVSPLDMEIRAGAGQDIPKTDLTDTISAAVTGTATGERIEESKATGTVTLQNRQTRSIPIARGTRFQTPQGVAFVTTEAATLPASTITFPVTIVVGTVNIRVEAVDAGPGGNVPAGRITVSPSPGEYEVTNPTPTTGGETKRFPVVKIEDYNAARARAPDVLQSAARQRLQTWRAQPPSGSIVFDEVFSEVTFVAPPDDVVGREIATFEVTVRGTVTAYAYSERQPTAAAVERYRATMEPGYDLVDEQVQVTSSRATSEGINWTVRVSGSRIRHVDEGEIQRALAGRDPAEAEPILESFGLRADEVRSSPGWWPRLPLLAPRIDVTTIAAR